MRTSLEITYKTFRLRSKFIERTEEELSILKEVCIQAVKGNTDILEIVSNHGDLYYISRKILVKSIICVKYEEQL